MHPYAIRKIFHQANKEKILELVKSRPMKISELFQYFDCHYYTLVIYTEQLKKEGKINKYRLKGYNGTFVEAI